MKRLAIILTILAASCTVELERYPGPDSVQLELEAQYCGLGEPATDLTECQPVGEFNFVCLGDKEVTIVDFERGEALHTRWLDDRYWCDNVYRIVEK